MSWSIELIPTILNKIDNKATKLSGFPHITQNGKWTTTLDGDWTGGFWNTIQGVKKEATTLKGKDIKIQALTPRIRIKLRNRKVERFAELE